jgi:hypothetical protein
MTGTALGGAYLYGVDLRNASIAGADFTDAVLTGANFAAATIGTDVTTGAVTKFNRAYLQGTNLDQAQTLAQADLSEAFFDFRPSGNIIFIGLAGGDHNQFACPTPETCTPSPGNAVCAAVRYSPTTVPTANTTITCPDKGPAAPSGCGETSAATSRWNGGLTIGVPPPGTPPGWYADDATYTPRAPTSSICDGFGARILNW